MTISLFDLFSIGIGPSSSHTVGPMKAACAFSKQLEQQHQLAKTKRITIELFGSLAFTGFGHGTDKAILLGLEGEEPDTIDPASIGMRMQTILNTAQLNVLAKQPIHFNYREDLQFNTHDTLPFHTNAMRFSAFDENGLCLFADNYYSIGGGFILNEEQTHIQPTSKTVPFAFTSADSLLQLCVKEEVSIYELMLKNEATIHPHDDIKQRALHIIAIMQTCIEAGCHAEGILPGGLYIPRRAPGLFQKLTAKGKPKTHETTDSMEWLNLFAIAVNEENAAGGRIVTAPTNGAAGIIPAVLQYYLTFYPEASPDKAVEFLFTAGAIGLLYKRNASISGAEVGCQGEVGVACSMAAAALTAVLGGTLWQVENAAEIAMEHHLGLTCDPINGLVQIPCIERNAMGAVKAVNAARLALLGDGKHYVSLDKVIATMKQTGKDMKSIYKETSQGGLAANLPEC